MHSLSHLFTVKQWPSHHLKPDVLTPEHPAEAVSMPGVSANSGTEDRHLRPSAQVTVH